MVWNDPQLANPGHVVGIAAPAWHHMHVEMFGDARASSRAEIETNVKTVRAHGLAEYLLAVHGEFAKFGTLSGLQFREGSRMDIWYHHKMPVIIGIEVHDDKG